jgi:hypothetical protein
MPPNAIKPNKRRLQLGWTLATLPRMGYLIGTDEAGYGPNLGPLVISATVWESPEGIGAENLFEHVGHLISPRLKERAGTKRTEEIVVQTPSLFQGRCRHSLPSPSVLPLPCVVMADSKMLYSPERGLRHLERGLWAAFDLLGCCPRTWRDVWRTLDPEALDAMTPVPWYAGYDAAAPIDYDVGEEGSGFGVQGSGDGVRTPNSEPLSTTPESQLQKPKSINLHASLAEVGVRLAAVRSRAVFAHEFNDAIERHGLKSTALSHETLALAARLIDALPPGPISVVCDKHGGRNRYADLLADHFPDCFIEVHGEGRQRSVYRFGPPDRRIEFCFRTKAESCLPAALASMASKYLRELAMRAFNEFWRRRIPELRPTAGYPEDAKRFRVDIAETQQRLKISDRVLWRSK